VFSGWYLNAQGTGQPFDFSAPVNGSTTLYAGWSPTPAPFRVLSMGDNSVDIQGRSDNWFTFTATSNGTMSVRVTGYGRITGPGWARNFVYRPTVVTTSGGFVPEQTRNSSLTNANAAWGRIPQADMIAHESIDVAGNGNFGFTFEVKAGQKYYLFLRGHEETNSMNAIVTGLVALSLEALPSQGGLANLVTGSHEVIRHADITKDFIIPPATKAGYTFNGWFTQENGGGERVTNETGARTLNVANAVPAQVFAYFVPN
jgi:uncharacterized repeat protein (TIGR02543 family)